MGYRDETDGLRARVAELEQELGDARARIRQLERGPAPGGGIGRLLLGGPSTLVHEIEIDGEVPEPAHEEMVEALRERFGMVGQTTRVGRTLAWTTLGAPTQRFVEISVSARKGRTLIRARERLSNQAGGLFGGVVGGAGLGGLGLIVPVAVALGARAVVPFIAAVWVLGIYAAVRAGFGGLARRRDAELRAAVDTLNAIASEHVAQSRARVRVEPAEDRSDEQAELEEAEQAERERAERR